MPLRVRVLVAPALLAIAVAVPAVVLGLRAPFAASQSPSGSAIVPSIAAPGFTGPDLKNPAAYVPAQCYAATIDQYTRRPQNGCFVCHQTPRSPNYIDDAALQTELSFPSYVKKNRWPNLLEAPAPVALSNEQLLELVRSTNYFDGDGQITLARRLKTLPDGWDADQDGSWSGFVPDCWFHVDARGFDRDPHDVPSGWRAYSSPPIPGLFFPTNGAFGDTFIRLPPVYRTQRDGSPSEEVYAINLALLEAYVQRHAVSIPATDERALDSDLDGDGQLGIARQIAFVWPADGEKRQRFVGAAAELTTGARPVAGLFPAGTEFLHSLRYLDVVGKEVRIANRFRELRYMRKTRYFNYSQLQQNAELEQREKRDKPDKLKRIFGNGERGITTGSGWLMQGFIENVDGELRPQSLEETAACIGCHGGVGATTDSTFSFARKLPYTSFQHGWFHPSQRDLSGVSQLRRADGQGEYSHWLEQVGGGDDFRSNSDVRRTFFRADGSLDPKASRALFSDISNLILPSPERAFALNSAYLGLVRTQRFSEGRELTLGEKPQILSQIEAGTTGITQVVSPAWLSR